ncbi:MAG: hypothetical protein AB1749_17560 [Pseudomonadota bacterium]
MSLRLATALSASLALATGVLAEDAGRYRMSPTDGGFVRLDTQTGAMALCAKRDQGWSCTAMADDQASQRQRIETLEAENKALRDEIKRLEEVLGVGESKPGTGAAPPAPPGGAFKLPSEEDIDKGFDYLDRMLKKFRDRMKKLEGGSEGDGRTL